MAFRGDVTLLALPPLQRLSQMPRELLLMGLGCHEAVCLLRSSQPRISSKFHCTRAAFPLFHHGTVIPPHMLDRPAAG